VREGKAVDGYVVHEVAPDVVVRVERAMPDLPPALDQEVERLWRLASERVSAGGAGRMFNGRVFSADVISPRLISGHLSEYRRVVAQIERPSLHPELKVRSFAVCGVLRCPDGVVIGRRHRAAVYQAGLWQLPPAGSVDAGAVSGDGTVDVRRQLLRELREELGLPPQAVGEPRPLCIVEHPGSHVADFGLELITRLSGEVVVAAHRGSGNGEYEKLRVVPEAEMPAFLAECEEAIVPPTREFLVRAGVTTGGSESSR
jgi:8-oxo-dGTP pyrophosphatase MutT (NUDIX family)